MAADGSDPRFVGPGSGPAWSPDGTVIAYAETDGVRGVGVMNADGTGTGNVGVRTPPSGCAACSGSWWPTSASPPRRAGGHAWS